MGRPLANIASLVNINVRPRGKSIKPPQGHISLRESDSTALLYAKLADESGLSVHRLRISLGPDGDQVVANANGSTLSDAGIADGAVVYAKDLGPQIDWRTVYVIEYLGPLVIHPLIYKLRLAKPSPAQTLTLYMIMGQFAKRELESLFVHRFSNATMPLRNVFKNSFHYWVLSGALLAWFAYSPEISVSSNGLSPLAYLGLFLYAVGLSMNTYIHLIQRSLRPAGTDQRRIPSGPGFAWVTCPNYMFETLTWTGVFLVVRNWSVLLFIVVSVAQMKVWADKKEARYRREFPDAYVKKRHGVIPGIL
ncbi:DNA mismatch repair protein msh6 [Hypoxylon texense]